MIATTRHERNWLEACGLLAPLFSTCARRQYFAVLLAANRRVIGVGYNGAPPKMEHCNQGGCPRAMSDALPGSRYDNCVAQHAEAGALLWSDPALRQGSTLIVNGPPCFDCAKLIMSAGVARVVCLFDGEYERWPTVERFLRAGGVEVVTE